MQVLGLPDKGWKRTRSAVGIGPYHGKTPHSSSLGFLALYPMQPQEVGRSLSCVLDSFRGMSLCHEDPQL